jgi:REP element-mobilizing transposase RayT
LTVPERCRTSKTRTAQSSTSRRFYVKSLAHTKWECKYHVVWIPKYRKKKLFGELRKELGPVLRELARQRESEILEGKLMVDHVHMLIAIPPKHAVSQVVGVYQREECDLRGPQLRWARKELHGGTLLGTRLLCVNGGDRRSGDPAVHPTARGRRPEAGSTEAV